MNEHSKPIKTKLIESLELPKDLCLGLPNISLIGNREFYISNHRGILTYTDSEIIILIKNAKIQIIGRELVLSVFTKEEISITGNIHTIGFL